MGTEDECDNNGEKSSKKPKKDEFKYYPKESDRSVGRLWAIYGITIPLVILMMRHSRLF